jgi:ubiquinone/menaquinone biosynthesis C-methylase UbiE
MESKELTEVEKWDSFSDIYTEMAVNGTLQTNISLYNCTRAKEATAICEVGVGPGIGPLVFATTMMKKGAVYYNSDISEGMIRNFQKVFEEAGMTANPSIKFRVLEKGSNVDKIENFDEKTKQIFVTVADNEELPYPDESFDCYLAHLSLMHVENYDKMLREAFRVTKTGAKIGISVMGRPGNFKLFAVIPEALKTVTELPKLKESSINFWDTEVLKALLEEYGFKKAKMTYLTATMEMTPDEAFNFGMTHFRFKKIFESLDLKQKDKAKKAFLELWNEKFGDESLERPTIEHLIATAEK